MYYHKFETRNIKIVLVGDQKGLSQLMIENDTKTIFIDKNWKESEVEFIKAKQQLIEYLDGKRTSFQLELNPSGTEYQKKVWQALSQIPYGNQYTYKQIAELTGNTNASRAVGMANNKNPIPIIIPCHRVVGSNKKLTGYAYGLELKKRFLDLEKINQSFHLLAKHYGNINRTESLGGKSWWPAKNAFEMMTGAILTQNTNWKNVEKALQNIGNKLNPDFIEKVAADQLAELIRSSGYHNQKSHKLKALCNWFKSYQFDINRASKETTEKLRKELLATKGIGGETADSILVYALKKPSFVIDAYTRRIFHRIGIEFPNDYEGFRQLMEQSTSRDVQTYDYYHGLIVEHAKAFCTNKPQCRACPLEAICEKKAEKTDQKKYFNE